MRIFVRLIVCLCVAYTVRGIYKDIMVWFAPMASAPAKEEASEPIPSMYDAYMLAECGPDTSDYQVHEIDACGSMAENLGVVFQVHTKLPESPLFELWIPANPPFEAEVRVVGKGAHHRIPLKNVPIRIFRRHQPTSIARISR